MLKVTVDTFSGVPNPEWTIDDGTAVHEILTEIALHRGSVVPLSEMGEHLGFRGLIVETLDDDISLRYGIGHKFAIATGASLAESKSQEIAERILVGFHFAKQHKSAFMDIEANRVFLKEQLQSVRLRGHRTKTDSIAATGLSAAGPCYYEVGTFNPDFWNLDQGVRTSNNCYNYARNKRTNTFAQPGRAHGYSLSLNCASVTEGALRDGAHRRFDCFPDTENPRWMMALVIWPGRDYHWYREAKEGFWGHKPGQTNAKNTDNSGAVIGSPETCNRGPYTDFCGRFYACKSMVIS